MLVLRLNHLRESKQYAAGAEEWDRPLPLCGEKLMHLLIPPVHLPTWVRALKDSSLITPRAESYFGLKAKNKQLASDSSCATRAIPEVPDVWKHASAAASSTGGETYTAFSTVEGWKKSPLLSIFLRSWLLSSLGYLRKCGFPHPNQPIL